MAEQEYNHDPGDDKDVTVLMWKLTKRQWQRIVKTVDDPKSLFKTYALWQADSKVQREKCLKKGYKIVDLDIDIDGTLAWCQENRQPVNLKSFSRYIFKLRAAARR